MYNEQWTHIILGVWGYAFLCGYFFG